jgi:hypothetical protein
LVGSGGASVAPQAASVTPAAVMALTRKKSRRLSLFSSIFPSFGFGTAMYVRCAVTLQWKYHTTSFPAMVLHQ